MLLFALPFMEKRYVNIYLPAGMIDRHEKLSNIYYFGAGARTRIIGSGAAEATTRVHLPHTQC